MDTNRIRQKKKQPGAEQRNESASLFSGRILLKNIYSTYHLLDERDDKSIQLPDDCLLRILPALEHEGLDAVHEYLLFSHAGITVRGCEGGYEHHSREKLAIMFIVINSELSKPLHINAIIRDELIGIRKLSELVDWIENMKSDKDLRAALERPRKSQLRHQPIPQEKPIEKFYTRSELAGKLNISERTISKTRINSTLS